MPNYGSIELVDSATFDAIVQDTGRSIILVLHDDAISAEAYRILGRWTSKAWTNCMTIWSKNPALVQTTVMRLAGSEVITWDPLGHRVVSINRNDVVTVALSRAQSEDPVMLLGAFWNALKK